MITVKDIKEAIVHGMDHVCDRYGLRKLSKKHKDIVVKEFVEKSKINGKDSKKCPYDAFACKVYSFCGTKKCLDKKK